MPAYFPNREALVMRGYLADAPSRRAYTIKGA